MGIYTGKIDGHFYINNRLQWVGEVEVTAKFGPDLEPYWTDRPCLEVVSWTVNGNKARFDDYDFVNDARAADGFVRFTPKLESFETFRAEVKRLRTAERKVAKQAA